MDLGQLRGLVTEGANLKVGLGVGEREWGRKILDFASPVSREGDWRSTHPYLIWSIVRHV